MKFVWRLVASTFSNAVALAAAAWFVEGFVLRGDLKTIAMAAGIFTLINVFVKPVLKFFFTPFIVLTLGLFLLVINAAALKMLTFFTDALTIQGYGPLFYGTLIVTVVNMFLGFAWKRFESEE